MKVMITVAALFSAAIIAFANAPATVENSADDEKVIAALYEGNSLIGAKTYEFSDEPDYTGDFDLTAGRVLKVFKWNNMCPLCKATTVNADGEIENGSPALKTETYTVNGVDFKMILVEHGTFTMGSNDTDVEFSESPAHTVTLTEDYLMGETEVTEALWNAVMGNGGGSNTHPKTSVTWKNAHTFVEKLTELAHEQGIIPSDRSFHMPTEAQWEFAAKGGNLSKGYLYSGSNDINEVAVTYENSGSNSPIDVKTKSPNELGIYDMSGNAYEWVDDYGGKYSSEAQTDPQNTSGRNYVKRGGSNYHRFSSEPYLFTTTGRYFYGSTDWTIGFRICMY